MRVQHAHLARHRVEAGPAPADVEALICLLRLCCRRPIHFGEARIQGTAWSDRSADAALAEALDAFLINAGR